MRRPSLKNFSPVWGKVIVLATVFAAGALFDKYVIPHLYRDILVYGIKGVKGRGCEGGSGATLIRFGMGPGQASGYYKFPCDEFSFASETVALHCECE